MNLIRPLSLILSYRHCKPYKVSINIVMNNTSWIKGVRAKPLIYFPLFCDVFYLFHFFYFLLSGAGRKRYFIYFPAGTSGRYFLFLFFYFFSACQMGPFGAWLNFTAYEDDILFIFPSAASRRYFLVFIFLISLFSGHPAKMYFIYF